MNADSYNNPLPSVQAVLYFRSRIRLSWQIESRPASSNSNWTLLGLAQAI